MSRLSHVGRFVTASKRARSADELGALMEPITREMRFDGYAVVRHVRQFQGDPESYAIHNYPRDWVDYYLENNLSAHDPVLLASRRTAVGFRFEELPDLVELTEERKNVMLEARRRGGITDGFHVPVHVSGEQNGSCTFIMRQGAPLPANNLLMAQLVGFFAYQAARVILRTGQSDAAPPTECPTSRQLECILLVGRGKTDWEIARLLGITEHTVTAHINEARRRYGVSRRSELPVQALYRGDLGFSDLLS